MEVINEELRLKDEEYFNANLEKLEKLAIRGGDKKLKPEYVRRSLCQRQFRTFIIVTLIISLLITGHFFENQDGSGRREETHQVRRLERS